MNQDEISEKLVEVDQRSKSTSTAIKLFLSEGTFPSGTVVEWWERG